MQLYETVLEAQQKTIEVVKSGSIANELDHYCRALLGNKLSREFIHGLGHGVGTQVHEWPSINGRSEAVLQENMLITIEPGVYAQGKYGIRIEDDVLVGARQPIVLTQTTKELIYV